MFIHCSKVTFLLIMSQNIEEIGTKHCQILPNVTVVPISAISTTVDREVISHHWDEEWTCVLVITFFFQFVLLRSNVLHSRPRSDTLYGKPTNPPTS